MARKTYDRKLYDERIKPLLDAAPGTDAEKETAMRIPNKIISNWNNAGYMSWTKYFSELSAFLGVSVEYLKGETDDPYLPDSAKHSEKGRLLISLFERLSEEQQDWIIAQLQGLA